MSKQCRFNVSVWCMTGMYLHYIFAIISLWTVAISLCLSVLRIAVTGLLLPRFRGPSEGCNRRQKLVVVMVLFHVQAHDTAWRLSIRASFAESSFQAARFTQVNRVRNSNRMGVRCPMRAGLVRSNSHYSVLHEQGTISNGRFDVVSPI